MKKSILLLFLISFQIVLFGQLNFNISKVKGFSNLEKGRIINLDSSKGPVDITQSKHKYEIRLSAFYAPVGGSEYFILYSDSNNWKALHWKLDLYNLFDSTIPKYKTIKDIHWDTVINNLNTLGIYTLPNQSDLKIKSTVYDGSMFTISYKVENKFREYHFDNPDIYRKEYPNTIEFKRYMEITTIFYNTFKTK